MLQTKIVLKSRLGFVKMAIHHGAELVPVFVFGEKWLYKYVLRHAQSTIAPAVH